jgi:putative metallohydrolase (TIGR04338 family)
MPKKRTADNCVTELYYAENHELPVGSGFGDIEEVQKYVDTVTATPYWAKLGNLPKKIRVHSNGDRPSSEAVQPNDLWLAIPHWHEQAILHELAHFADTSVGQDDHGPAFIRAYLGLLLEFRGAHYARLYRDAFTRVGVKF